MAKYEEKLKALDLRRKGNSIGDIAEKLDVSKSTVSRWCSDIELSPKQKKILEEKVRKAGHHGRMKGAQMNKRKKLNRIKYFEDLAAEKYSDISKRELDIVGTALYWAEGSKTKSRFGFSNSDPLMIKFIQTWLEEVYSIEKLDFVPRVRINTVHKHRIDKVLKFWSSLLELPLDQFKTTSFIHSKNKKIYENHDDYYGVLDLRVRKSSDLLYQIFGQINAFKNCRRSSVG